MTPIIVLGMGLAFLAGGTMAPSQGTFGQSGGTLRPGPTYVPTYTTPPPPAHYTPRTYSAPQPPPSVGTDRFRPYEPQSVYSNRGGANAYPSAPKPQGYIISPYGK
jgi:hypothetical protein